MQRLPAILFDEALNSLKNINLAKYEIYHFEPMHDIANHVEHILNWVPKHLEKKTEQKFMDALTLSYTNKNTERCCDHKLGVVKVLLHDFVYFPKIQHIVYAEEYARTNQNLIFLPFINLKEVVSHTSKNYFPRKFYGK